MKGTSSQKQPKVKNMIAQNATQMLENMSVYIPHVFPNFTTEYIASVFENLGIGVVNHIDLVAKMDKHGKYYRRTRIDEGTRIFFYSKFYF